VVLSWRGRRARPAAWRRGRRRRKHAAHLAEEAILIGGDRFGHGEITASRDGRTLDEHFAPMCTIENGEIVAIETTSPIWAA
jgi:ketosteroid isomerase-like protein